MGDEIERKWRLKAVPEVVLREGAAKHITQGYLYISDRGEVRLRYEGNTYYLTCKGKGDLSRPEENYPLLSEMAFIFLWPNIIGQAIEKTRYTSLLHGHVYQFDVHEGYLEGYICVEVEFSTEEEANAFVLPSWVGEAIEVTDDKRYKSKYLALNHKTIREELGL